MRQADRLTRILASYGSYHRAAGNRLTHYFGVPVIIYAVLVALARSAHPALLGTSLRLDRVVVAVAAVGYIALVVVAVAAVGYIALDVGLGFLLALVLTLLAAAAEATSALGPAAALTVAAAVFVLGWALQLLGHRLEGNRPALLTNIAQIFVAPLFLIAELGFSLGLRRRLRDAIEQQLRPGAPTHFPLP